jgi:hypothetical protein
MALRANTEIVAITWVGGVTGITKVAVGNELPDEITDWSGTGFVVIKAIGGSRDMYVPMINPVVTIECWAVSTTSIDPPWDVSEQLAETIDRGCRSRGSHRIVTPRGYGRAQVHSAYLTTEPRRLYFGDGNYARVGFDMALHWTDLS